MSRSVKITEDAKRLLDTLQAKVVLSAGRKPSQEELLEMIVKLSSEKEEELIMRLSGVKFPFARHELETLLRVPSDWGAKTSEEDIDKVLYGRRSRTTRASS